MAATAAGIGAGAALYGGSTVASVAGFTSAGIAAGTPAATAMAVLGGAATQAGSAVATMQAVGALGTVFVSAPAVIATGGVGAVAGYVVYQGLRLFF